MNRALTTVLLAALATAGTYVAMDVYVRPHLPMDAVEVPSLDGLTQDQARGLAESRGLLLAFDGTRATSRVAPGMVAEQRPLGGSRVRRGEPVHAWLAQALAQVSVPPLAGESLAQARSGLATAGLKEGKVIDAPSGTVPKGAVIGSDPAAGAAVAPATAIDLTVSSGPSQKAVPALLGKGLKRAKALLEQAGFVLGSRRNGVNDDYDEGTIIKQSPAAGTPAPVGSKIDVVVND